MSEPIVRTSPKHRNLLYGERIVSRRKVGAKFVYAIGDETVLEICDIVCGGVRCRLRDLVGPYAPASRATNATGTDWSNCVHNETADGSMLRALREAAGLLGRTPGRTTYDRLHQQGLINGPSGGRIAYRWGRWTIACERAGLTPNKRAGQLGRPTYSEEDYRAALRRVAAVLNTAPTQQQYAALRRTGEPSAPAFARRYRGWLNARDALLGRPHADG
jgi:hypothetical protein